MHQARVKQNVKTDTSSLGYWTHKAHETFNKKGNWLRFIRKAGTQKWKYHLRCLTHQHTFPSTPKLCSPSRPSLRPGGSALCLQAKAKSLPGNPAQQPVGIIRDGWHLASMARCGPQRWPQSQPAVTATLLLQQISNRACTLPDIFSSQTHPPLPFLRFTVTQRKMSKSRATGHLIISALVLSKHPIATCLVAFTLTRYYRTHFMALTSSCDTLSVETIIKVNEKHQNAPIVNPIYHAAWSHFTTGVGLTGIKGGSGRRSQWVMQGRAWPISMWHAKSSKSH